MTTVVVLYIAFGAGFGLLTFSRRHLFSEGPTRRADAASAGAREGRITWALVCSCLWPIMALTGLFSLWRLWRRAATARGGEPR